MSKTKQLIEEASQFIRICYKELNKEQFMEERMKEIQVEIEKTGTYEHTFEELVHGSRMAWRNSNRCIGRLFWSKMHILDAREVNDEEGVYNALIHHIKYATNDGKVKPTITIFKQYQGEENNIRIYNHQLIRYAGYKTEMGVIGDSHSAAFTDFCQELGWQGEGTHYDVLPLVFSVDGKEPVYKEIPKKEVKEVPIEHPEYPISSLGVKWYGVPMISDMRLEIGGISYTAAPFNGWYMGTEIGARNLADHDRYNLLPAVAEMMNLDTSRNGTLWKDKALIELNVAVLHSFKKQGVSIVDHHTAAQQFQQFEKQEAACGRVVTGNWVWLIPPLSPATTHIYHKPYPNEILKPNFFHK
ncbi:nitric oxide synthase oxygenase [Bacillus sp. GX]|uniref:Nitric oxide synthase oxygenase n=1 Tax=Bacillus albus TaxID=2026189 RepID=A0A1J9V2Y7_9BACI|nr:MULTISPECIES: nitric oxide synthase oxygenase [Bacillus]AZQ45300.1 nitric oxide synthase [Bacillus albus]MDA2027319.1 nitric oxide synthase oxygenase [Bacillus cereus group sp. Bcc03]MDA2217428.1 nitric oxide synthase oxygenase [Bacillus cereus group sp. Bc228]MDA2228999.1 nitric oxide synthase oxygenase [Bacillus cereus group sp. Bc227]MDA2261824.1 nitric oxide synthase oxygenase [Bacillus cereus group sp. Bc200]